MLGDHPERAAAQLLSAPPWVSQTHQSHSASDSSTPLLAVSVGDPQPAVLMDDPLAAGLVGDQQAAVLVGDQQAAGLTFWAGPGTKNAFDVPPQF